MKTNIIIQPYNLSVPSPDSHRMNTYISRFDDLCRKEINKVTYFGNPGPDGTKYITVKSSEFTELYRQIKLAESPGKYFACLTKRTLVSEPNTPTRKHTMLCIQRYLYELQRLVTVEDVQRIVIFDPYILYIIWVLTQYFKHNPYAQLNQRIQVIYTPTMQPIFTDSTLSKLINAITHNNAYPIHFICSDYKLTTVLLAAGVHNSQLVKLPVTIFDDSKILMNALHEKIHVVISLEALAKRDTLDSKIEIRVPAYYTIHNMNNWESNMETVVCNMYCALEQIVDTLVQKCKLADLRLARHLTHQGLHIIWDIACFYVSDSEVDLLYKDELTNAFAEQDWHHVLDCRLLSMSLLPHLGPVSISVTCELNWVYSTTGINLLSELAPCLEFAVDIKQLIRPSSHGLVNNGIMDRPSSQAESSLVHVSLPNPRLLPGKLTNHDILLDQDLDLDLDYVELQTVTYDFHHEQSNDRELVQAFDLLILDDDILTINNNSRAINNPEPELETPELETPELETPELETDKPEKTSIPKPENTYHPVVEPIHEPIIELKADELPKFAPIFTKASLVEKSVLDMAVDEWLDGAQFLARCSARPGHIIVISRTQMHTDFIHGSNRFRYEPAVMEQVNSKYFGGLIPVRYDSPYKLYQHIGIESGLIMSRAQITRWFPDVIFEKNPITGQIICGMLTDMELDSLSEFVTANIYSRPVDYFLGRCSILQSSVGPGTSNATTKYRLGVLIQCGSGQSAGKIAEELLEMALAMVGRVSVVIGINISMGIGGNSIDYSGLLNRLQSVKLPSALFAYVITSTPDLGTDISPFFMQFSTLTNMHGTGDGSGLGLDIDYILKLHTKTNSDWRKRLCKPFIGGLDSIMGLLTRLDTDKTIGMLGAKECVGTNNKFCDTKLETYFPECTYTKYRAQYRYVAGTVFLTRTHIISDTITIDPKFTKALLLMPYYYDNALFPTNSPAHTFERIMGYMASKKYKQGVSGI